MVPCPTSSCACCFENATAIDTHADPLFAASRTWESLSPYNVTRHAKQGNAADALSADLCAECRRCGLPHPRVTPRELRGVPQIGLTGGARVTFDVAVNGPIVLGRSRHFGGGVFAGSVQAPDIRPESGNAFSGRLR